MSMASSLSLFFPFPKRYKFLWKMTSEIVPARLTTLLDLLTSYEFDTARACNKIFLFFSPTRSSPSSSPPWTQRGVLPLTRWRFHSQFTLAAIFVCPIYIADIGKEGRKQDEERGNEYSDERNLVPQGIAINVK